MSRLPLALRASIYLACAVVGACALYVFIVAAMILLDPLPPTGGF